MNRKNNIYLFIYLFIYLYIYLFIYLFIYSVNVEIRSTGRLNGGIIDNSTVINSPGQVPRQPIRAKRSVLRL